MSKYEQYLLSVKEHNPDEYQEIPDILSRYYTLKISNDKLTSNLLALETELETLKSTVTKYEKDMKTEIMSLNNDTTNLKQRYEGIED